MITQRRYLPSFAVLRSFEAAARHESFTMAAEELSLTQSAISRQIKDLEQSTGVELFRRVGRRVKLTQAGDTFARELALDLERLSQTVFRAIAAGEQKTALRIATLPTFASRWLIPRLVDFKQKNPGIQVNLTVRVEPFDLSAEHIDAALHFGEETWPDAYMERFCEESMFAVCSPSFQSHHGLNSVEQLIDCPLLHLETRPTAWVDWLTSVKVEGHRAIPGMRFGQYSMIISAALSGLGAALIPGYLIEQELEEKRLVLIDERALTTTNAYYIVRPKGHVSPATQIFIDWMFVALETKRS